MLQIANWVAVQEPKLTYNSSDTILLTIYPHYGNFPHYGNLNLITRYHTID